MLYTEPRLLPGYGIMRCVHKKTVVYLIHAQRDDAQVRPLWRVSSVGGLFDEETFHRNRGKLLEVFITKPSGPMRFRTYTSDQGATDEPTDGH